MFARFFCVLHLVFLQSVAFAQENLTVVQDLRDRWQVHDENGFAFVHDQASTGIKTIYLELPHDLPKDHALRISAHDVYYLFVNGKIRGEFTGQTLIGLDSLTHWAGSTGSPRIALHQDNVNLRDLRTEIVSTGPVALGASEEPAPKPYSPFRDFTVVASLLVIVLFVMSLRLNPKLAGDYFSVLRLLSSRETDDAQASARLTSGANVLFYVLCSLLISLYLLIVMHNLPSRFSLPIRFEASSFGMIWVQWLKLSVVVFVALLVKLLIIYALTRLFGMRGLARYHFFNWIRLLLVLFSLAASILFMYFISRGSQEQVFVVFLWVVVFSLVIWIALAVFKLSGRTGHSMFHLFSYLCATEVIPLLITVKVLFQ